MSKLPPKQNPPAPAEKQIPEPVPPPPKLKFDIAPKAAEAKPAPAFLPAHPHKKSDAAAEPDRPEPAQADPGSPAPEQADYLRSQDFFPILTSMLRSPVPLVGALAGLLAISLLVGILAWQFGAAAGKDRLIREQSKQTPELSPGATAKIDQAMAELFSGNVGAAKGTLQELQSLDPDIAPLSYLLALAAFRSGELQRAESKARESIAKRERVSDSLAMLSLIESHRAGDPKAERLGDPLLRGEFLLRQAARADAANPLPLIELSANLREQNRLPEAIRLLESAASRVQPVDTPTFVAATLALARLQNLTDADLPEIPNPDKDLPTGFSAAYVALRKGDAEGARKILIRLRQTTDPRLFRYIIHDQAFRWYASEIKAGDQPATD